ncbi:MAG: F0F1 ATP synthase subunit alpha, partial [Prolixibacteraceae bacterium]
MANIKPAEVSEILRQQLEGFKSQAELEEVGTVLQVGDGIARIYGLSNVESNEMIEFDSGVKGIVLNLEEDNVGAVILGLTKEIKEGDTVKRLRRTASIEVGEGLLGRVINTLGEPIDGKGVVTGEKFVMPLERKAPGVIFRQPVTQPLQTGLKAIDAMIPIGRGQRELIIGDRQTGKTAVAVDAIINQRENFEKGQPVYCIYVAIGQKGSTIANLANTLQKHGAMEYTVI